MEKSNRLFLLSSDFAKTLKQCEGYHDDRGVFVNCYNMLVEAVKEFESLEINSTVIKVAFADKYNSERNELQSLQKSLFIRGMITDF